MRSASASGKIILSGEYAVLFGKSGIAIPSELRVKVMLEESQKNDGMTIVWAEKNIDVTWKDYAKKIAQKIVERTKNISGTLTIENKLPLGKGMGSSTALIIAMCRCIVGPDSESIARELEDELNPGHSGIDFAVIWEEKPILFAKDTTPTVIDLPKNLLQNMRLIDTGKPNEATPELVAWVRARYEAGEPETRNAIEIIGACTERILADESIKTVMRDHHRAQITLGVVLKETQRVIADIEHRGGSAKVLGAGGRTGGGGMVLVLPA